MGDVTPRTAELQAATRNLKYFGSFKSFGDLQRALITPSEGEYGGGCCGCMQLSQLTWKEAYGRPGGAFAAMSPGRFLVIRALLFVTWLALNAVGIYMLVAPEYKYDFPMEYYMTKLTSWAACLLLAYLGFGLFSTAMALYSSHPDGKGPETPWWVSVTWMLQTTNLVLQPMVTLMYFTLVHNWDEGSAGGAGGGDLGSGGGGGATAGGAPDPIQYSFAFTFVGHGLNSVLTVADLLISRNRLVLAHFGLALAFSAVYLLFTVVYYVAGGTNEDGVSPYIYPALDWRGFGSATVMDDCDYSAAGGLGQLIPHSVIQRACRSLTTRVVASLLILIGVPLISVSCFCAYLCRRRLRRSIEESMAQRHKEPPRTLQRV